MGSIAFCNLKRIMEENNIPPNGIVHVGAHKGEELGIYAEIGFKSIYLFEPNPGVYDALCEAVRNVNVPRGTSISVERVAISTKEDRVAFAVPDRSQLATLLPDTLDGLTFDAIPVQTRPLSYYSFWNCNVLVLDTQGTELDVLKSGNLSQFDLIVCETIAKNMSRMATSLSVYDFLVDDLHFKWLCGFQHDHNPALYDDIFIRCKQGR